MKSRHSDLKQICQQFGVVALYTFGSQAKKIKDWMEGRKDDIPLRTSDVDIGVRVISGANLSVTEKAKLALSLEDLFDSNRVDLVLLPQADPFLAAEIIRGERLFTRDEHEADEYELYVLRRAGDLAPLERERMALVLGEIT
jgi:predicted nucleotidyltransferase